MAKRHLQLYRMLPYKSPFSVVVPCYPPCLVYTHLTYTYIAVIQSHFVSFPLLYRIDFIY
jgi:hypothetical protein